MSIMYRLGLNSNRMNLKEDKSGIFVVEIYHFSDIGVCPGIGVKIGRGTHKK